MKNSKIALAVTLALGISHAANAENDITWNATSELGYVMTSGNSDTETLTAKFNASTEIDAWKHQITLGAMNSNSNDIQSSEKYLIEGQSDYTISERSYALGVITWEKDRFGSYDHSTSVALGAGYKAIDEDNMKLNFELAPGYRSIVDHNGNNTEDAIVRLAETFSWKLSDSSTLDQNLSSEYGESNTTTKFGISLTSQVSGALSTKLGYALKHNSDVPAGSRSVDREAVVTLVYKH